MDTKYIGPFSSESEATGRSVKTGLRVEDSEAVPGLLEIGIYSREGFRYLRLDKDDVQELRGALSTWLKEQA